MKLTHPVLIALGLTSSAMLLPLAARAQAPSPAPSATPSVSAPATDATADQGDRHGAKHEGMKERMAALTPEERERVKAAREKAMQDPAVKVAEATKSTDRKGYRKTMHEAMLRADPTIGPVLEKLRPQGGHKGAPGADE